MTKNICKDRPVFITGRGGSGTRLMSRLLGDSKVFMGNSVSASGDSLEWVDISRELLFKNISIRNGSFDDVWRQRIRSQADECLANIDLSAYCLWGLKLPEMMFCLPEMMDVFPSAKIIHIVRHPVSLSLRRTHLSSRMDNPVGQTVLPRAYESLSIDSDIHKQDDYLNNAISWVYQLKRVLDYADEQLTDAQYLTVKYEDIVSNEDIVLSNVAQFLDIELNSAADLAVDYERVNRSVPFCPERSKVWEICGKTAERLSYTKDCL